MRLAIDLFCGTSSFSKVARTFGYEVISIDNRRRIGTCEPTLKVGVLDLPSNFFSSLNPALIWLGFPCTIWSNASGGHHLDKQFNPKTELAVNHLALLSHCLELIYNIPGTLFFIENPRGKLQRYPPLLEFIHNVNGYIYTCTLSSYGHPSTKPTVIISNFPNLKLRPLDAFGRGAKNKVPGSFNKATKVQRSITPHLLIGDILRQIEDHIF